MLSADELLTTWETAAEQHPLDRALTLLAAASGAPRAQLAQLPIGQRDEQLLRLRERLFGSRLEGRVECPACGEALEFSTATEAMRAPVPVENETRTESEAGHRVVEAGHRVAEAGHRVVEAGHRVVIDGFTVRFRLLDSRDLAAAAACSDVAAARECLLARCVLDAELDGALVPIGDLPAAVIAQLGAALASRDPQAEILLEFDCVGCGGAWTAPFDILSFLWGELAADARRLLGEVSRLARAHGWSEREILAMSPRRRQAYLELVAG